MEHIFDTLILASVFSKKIRAWQNIQLMKKATMNDCNSVDLTTKIQTSFEKKEGHASTSLKSLFESGEEKADSIIKKISEVVMTVCATDSLSTNSEKTTRYVVNMSKETQEAIKNNLIKLDQGKDKQIYAQFRDSNNRYGKKLSISEELADQGIDSLEAMNALHLKAIQAQLVDMADAIDAIGQDVAAVLLGQQNDRIGLFRSGQALFLEAQNIQNESFKMIISAQALKALSDATGQLSQQLMSDINYLIEGKHKNNGRSQSEEIEDRMESINKCFDAIHKAVLLRMSVYFESGELPAMLAIASDFGQFLEEVVVPNAARLAEFDRKDNLLKGGVWEKRARSFSDIEEIKGQLISGAPLYIEASTGDENHHEG